MTNDIEAACVQLEAECCGEDCRIHVLCSASRTVIAAARNRESELSGAAVVIAKLGDELAAERAIREQAEAQRDMYLRGCQDKLAAQYQLDEAIRLLRQTADKDMSLPYDLWIKLRDEFLARFS